MPIGTPKVLYIRNDRKAHITVYERLLEERIVFLCRNMEFSFVNYIIGLLLFLNEQDETEIFLYINSNGGAALSAMALYDTIEFLVSDVCTLTLGIAASMASLILAAGTIPKRVAFPNARIMIHQPSTGYFSGTADHILMETEEMSELRNTIAKIYAQKTNKPVNVIQNDLERDTFMSAKQAQDYRIIDRVAIEKNPY